MRLLDFLVENMEAVEEEKERQDKMPKPKHAKYRPKRHR